MAKSSLDRLYRRGYAKGQARARRGKNPAVKNRGTIYYVAYRAAWDIARAAAGGGESREE